MTDTDPPALFPEPEGAGGLRSLPPMRSPCREHRPDRHRLLGGLTARHVDIDPSHICRRCQLVCIDCGRRWGVWGCRLPSPPPVVITSAETVAIAQLWANAHGSAYRAV